jgi:hypothetical protein
MSDRGVHQIFELFASWVVVAVMLSLRVALARMEREAERVEVCFVGCCFCHSCVVT